MKNLGRISWLILCFVTVAHSEERFRFERTPGKLSKDAVPRHYRIELKPDLETDTVTGREIIEVEALKTVDRLVLNAHELEVSSATLAGGTPLKVTFDSTNQLVTLLPEKPLPPGKHQVTLEFRGKITEAAVGMFSMSYTAPSGKKKMLATQFEATDARRVFPCFDEPAFRATFELTAEVPDHFKAVSNMPVVETQPGAAGWKRVRFERSPSMPVYLLVLVAGELEELHDRAGKIETRIWFTEGKGEQARYALENSKRLLSYFEDYFGVPFPLPKLDHIAMPGGFGGAMEHWGAITYNERTLLYEPGKSSQATKEHSFGIMAHEMAHQWFGNIVTMAWWDNLWLNEGFASWMGTKCTDALNPEWNHWVRVDAGKSSLMARDARRSTHPIQQPVVSELQINDAFDDITYQKGMFFIRMLEDYLGEKDFRAGIRRYMKRHAYSNTTTADLWAALEEASNKPVAAFARDWTEQPGLPVVLARTDCRDGQQVIELRQERFTLLDPGAAPLRWKIPVSVLPVGQKAKQVLLENEPVRMELGACSAPVKLNAGSRGYYRVAYDRPTFARLRGAWEQFAEADRVNFLSDAWSMAETGRLPGDEYCELLLGMADERSLAVWEEVGGAIYLLHSLIPGESFRPEFEQRIIPVLRKPLVSLGVEPKAGEPATDGVLRAHLIELLGILNDQKTVELARRRFAAFRQDEKQLTGDLRATFLGIVGEHATTDEFEELTRLARAAVLEQDRQVLLNAITRARNPEMARRTLEMSLTKDFPPGQAARLVSGVSATVVHAPAAWEFMQQHYKELIALVGGPFGNMYSGTTVAGFSDETRATEYLEFVRKNYPPDALTKAEETADGIRYRAYLKALVLPAIKKWAAKGQI